MQTASQTIRAAQRDAAEAAVVRRLADKGLIDQDQPPARTESEQSATENIAFSYSRIQPKIDQQYSDQAWFYGGKAFDACISRCGLSFIKRVYSDGQSISVDVRITAAEAREMAAVLLSAADFAEANPDFGKVPA